MKCSTRLFFRRPEHLLHQHIINFSLSLRAAPNLLQEWSVVASLWSKKASWWRKDLLENIIIIIIIIQ